MESSSQPNGFQEVLGRGRRIKRPSHRAAQLPPGSSRPLSKYRSTAKRRRAVFTNSRPNTPTRPATDLQQRSNTLSVVTGRSVPEGLEGLDRALAKPVRHTRVDNDCEEEMEACSDDCGARIDQSSDLQHSDIVFENVMYEVDASSQTVTDSTNKAYRGHMKLFSKWLAEKGYVDSEDVVFGAVVSPRMPYYIAAWIMEKCEKSGDGANHSYANAMKMRASLTYGFGKLRSRGTLMWTVDEHGNTHGNPSVSSTVTSYMIALKRRKTRAGESPKSARAITPELLKEMWESNHKPQNWSIDPYAAGQANNKHFDSSKRWNAKGRRRRMLWATYTIAFWCLLRSDEVLRIRMEHIEFVSLTEVILTLLWRKTNQTGGIKPFHLHQLSEEYAYMCPIRALAEWIHVSGITTGYLFRQLESDRVNMEDVAMSSQYFLEQFRNNLLDVGIDASFYGTHSFRRGGCQWLYSGLRWDLRKICEWGGWSRDFNSSSIIKYLISWNDDPIMDRRDFLNPNYQPTVCCHMCGRKCGCR